MPFPLPLLLLGGAALFLSGRKRRTAGPLVSAYAPPALTSVEKKSGSGYANVSRERMQWIQTTLLANGYDVGANGVDGLYGPDTKKAVAAFQEDWGGLAVDGKPGPKTQAALEEAESQRTALWQTEPARADECDPINPNTWGAGNICDFDGTRWVRKPKSKTSLASNTLPPIGAKEVGFSADFSHIKIGSSYMIGVFDVWLDARRRNGLLPTIDYGPSFVDFFVNNPSSFLASVFGANKATGELIYGTLFTLSTAGIGAGINAIRIAAIKMASSATIKASTFGPMMAAMEKAFGTDAEGMAAAAVESYADFSKGHKVKVGTKSVYIKDLPGDKNSVQSFNKLMVNYIIKFQKMHFED